MSAHNIIELGNVESVDTAWERYAEMARQIASDHTLLFDRTFNEELARRHERWKRLFMLGERA